MPGSFLDTNVLLYQLSNDLGKAERAEALVREGGTIRVQVLNELANVARRKIGLAWTEVQALTERSEEHTSELQSLMRISYAVFCLKKKKQVTTQYTVVM